MTCHECDSEITPNDAFCPFCGIASAAAPVQSPTPEAVTAVEDPEVFDSTIVIDKPTSVDFAAAQSKSLFADEVAAFQKGQSDVSALLPVDETAAIAEEPLESTPEVVAVEPSEEIQEILEPLEPAVSESETIEPEPANDPEPEIEVASVPEIEAEPQPEAAPAISPVEDLFIPAVKYDEPADNIAQSHVESGAEPIEEFPAVDSKPVIGDGSDGPVEIAEAEKLEAETSFTEKPAVIEEQLAIHDDEVEDLEDSQEIAMPVDELKLVDGYTSKSTFDSVQIMDKANANEVPFVAVNSDVVADEAVVSSSSGITASSDSSKITGDQEGKLSSKLKPLSEGTVLNGRYEIVRKIGGGGMGAVYLASDNNLGGVLRAVKEMVQTHIEEEQQEKAINDFKRESMILSTLDHASIPTIFDYFYDEGEGRFYLVMKYISGGDLASRLRSAPEGRIDEKRVTEWAIQIIDVLDYLHNQPSTIVYRDLKPSNIMMDGNSGRVMLIDFGIARSISQKSEKGVTAVGTMGYAPPELFSGSVEPRSDIYSLGSTMFHLLTGADPQNNPLLIFDFQKNPRPRQINPQLSDQIESILMRSVEYNADARFGSASEMRTVLEDHLVNLTAGRVTYGVTEAPAAVSLANQNVFCGFCGQRIVATDLFCAFCGAKQPIAQHGVHSEIYTQPSPTARLVIEGTNELPAPTYSLVKDENLLGRRDPMSNIFPEVDLSKYDPQTKISRRHAKIWRDGTKFLIEDLGSSNGTLLSRSTIEPLRLTPNSPLPLNNGDIIIVGDASLHFVVG